MITLIVMFLGLGLLWLEYLLVTLSSSFFWKMVVGVFACFALFFAARGLFRAFASIVGRLRFCAKLKKCALKNGYSLELASEIYELILKKIRVKKKKLLVIEDSYLGLLSAKNIEIEKVYLENKYSKKDYESIKRISEYKLKNYLDFLRIINNL